MFFMSDESVSPHFETGVKGDIFYVFNSKPYLVTYRWIALLTRNIMTLTRGFYSIPGQNDGNWSPLSGCHFGQS